MKKFCASRRASAAAYNNLGALYFRQRDYQKAAAILEQGLKINPTMPSASALLGISLYEMAEYAKARPRLEAAVRANPNDANAQPLLGQRSERSLVITKRPPCICGNSPPASPKIRRPGICSPKST